MTRRNWFTLWLAALVGPKVAGSLPFARSRKLVRTVSTGTSINTSYALGFRSSYPDTLGPALAKQYMDKLKQAMNDAMDRESQFGFINGCPLVEPDHKFTIPPSAV